MIFNIRVFKKAYNQQFSNNFEKEIREEQEQKRQIEQQKKLQRDEFLNKKSIFKKLFDKILSNEAKEFVFYVFF